MLKNIYILKQMGGMKNKMEEIVKRAKNGDIRAIEELIHMNKVKLYKTARTFLSCEDDINEAIQSTLILVN